MLAKRGRMSASGPPDMSGEPSSGGVVCPQPSAATPVSPSPIPPRSYPIWMEIEQLENADGFKIAVVVENCEASARSR
jgi:hypothetical protein